MSVDYIEKGNGLHEAIRKAGHWLEQSNGVWQSSDDAAVQAIIDSYSLDDVRATIIASVKSEAGKRILAFLPEWKQSNLNARMNELNDARFARQLTDVEQTEIANMRLLWDRAKTIRNASDAHEADVKALTSFVAVLSYDWKSGWPEI